MNEMRLSCNSDVVALSAAPIAGSDGRYMSIATGPIRDKSPRMIAVLTRLEFISRSPREADALGRQPAAAGPEGRRMGFQHRPSIWTDVSRLDTLVQIVKSHYLPNMEQSHVLE